MPFPALQAIPNRHGLAPRSSGARPPGAAASYSGSEASAPRPPARSSRGGAPLSAPAGGSRAPAAGGLRSRRDGGRCRPRAQPRPAEPCAWGRRPPSSGARAAVTRPRLTPPPPQVRGGYLRYRFPAVGRCQGGGRAAAGARGAPFPQVGAVPSGELALF